MDKIISNKKSIHLYTRNKRLKKKSQFLTEEVWTIIFDPKCFVLISILFQIIFASFLLVRPNWGSDKSTRKKSPLLEFLSIIPHKISIDLVLLWSKTFSFLLPRTWIVLVFLTRSPKNFLDFFPRSWKVLQNLVNLAENNCQDLGKKTQKSKNFLGKKSMLFLGSLAKILDILGFLTKKSKNVLGFLSTILKNLAEFCDLCQE